MAARSILHWDHPQASAGADGRGRPPTQEHAVSLVGSLIAISLLLLAAVGIAGALLMGRSSRSANADDPDPDND
jgi:hypothetical protein